MEGPFFRGAPEGRPPAGKGGGARRIGGSGPGGLHARRAYPAGRKGEKGRKGKGKGQKARERVTPPKDPRGNVRGALT